MVRKIDIFSCTLHYKPLGGLLRLVSAYVFGGCNDWLGEIQREDYKNIILKIQPAHGRAANVVSVRPMKLRLMVISANFTSRFAQSSNSNLYLRIYYENSSSV